TPPLRRQRPAPCGGSAPGAGDQRTSGSLLVAQAPPTFDPPRVATPEISHPPANQAHRSPPSSLQTGGGPLSAASANFAERAFCCPIRILDPGAASKHQATWRL